jgi:hypothetical protein
LFKENICHFVSTLQPIGQLNLKAFFSQTNSKLMLFLQNNQATPF